ncbi:MAG: histidinol-phosphatase HisJ family protein [Candidatus Bathyarchaeota archaeon]|nr:histidinol-phosphatase HisJ family protein [Candidatus Bathyarchaeota archaeon]
MYDYHVHERHSGDASAEIMDYVAVAEKLGIIEIAFTTHLITIGPDVEISVRPQDILEYINEIEKAQKGTSVRLLTGLEVDFFPEDERNIERILSEHDLDFVLGSTHYVNGVDIGDPKCIKEFFSSRSFSEGVDEYYRVWRQAVESGLFDVMAHPDYWKKFVHLFRNPPMWSEFGDEVYSAIDALKKHHVGIEVNTSGVRHGTGGFFPMQEFLIAARAAGVNTVTIGSDSHVADTLGYGWREAVRQLKLAGFYEFSRFWRHRNVQSPLP